MPTLAPLAPLPRSFYARDPRLVARDLLGKLLIRPAPAAGAAVVAAYPAAKPAPAAGAASSGEAVAEPNEPLLAGRIVEAEAYLGVIDPGAHAYRGQTPRTAVLFGPPGHAYVYFIYGNHFCTNVSCHPPGPAEGRTEGCNAGSNEGSNETCHAGCVLLRALEPVYGLQAMAALRGLTPAAAPRLLTSGPGRLSQALGITRDRDNASDLCAPTGDGLYIADDGHIPAAISATPRINVTRAPLDEWRFLIPGNPFVSGKKLKV
jgi:DNA-3-methyladenine glycosylase